MQPQIVLPLRACLAKPQITGARFRNKKALSLDKAFVSRGARIRTWDPLVPNQVHYRTVLHPELSFMLTLLSNIPKRDAKLLKDCNKQNFNLRFLFFCDPTGTRTPNLQLRRLLLYPVELSDLNTSVRRRGDSNPRYVLRRTTV